MVALFVVLTICLFMGIDLVYQRIQRTHTRTQEN